MKTIQALKTACAEQALFDRYIALRDGKLTPKETTTHQESMLLKKTTRGDSHPHNSARTPLTHAYSRNHKERTKKEAD